LCGRARSPTRYNTAFGCSPQFGGKYQDQLCQLCPIRLLH
jgi:hypothetical protein